MAHEAAHNGGFRLCEQAESPLPKSHGPRTACLMYPGARFRVSATFLDLSGSN